MKSPTFHIIKSVRIANARMGRPVQEELPPISHPVKRGRSANRRPYVRRQPLLGLKTEGSDSTDASAPRRRGRRPGKVRGPYKPRAAPSTSDSLVETTIPVPSEFQPQVSERDAPTLKRLKQQRFLKVVEDGKPWTDEEMEAFEILYGDKLFDNTIDTNRASQADLGLLNVRTFRSYRTEAKGPAASGLPASGADTFAEARSVLASHGLPPVTDSQLLRLLHFFPNATHFLAFLRLEPEVLISYFERSKPSSRRRGAR